MTPSLFLYGRGTSISAQDVDSLRRWVYTAMAFSHYSNQVEGKLDIEARLIRERSGEALWDKLLRRASGARPVGAKIEATAHHGPTPRRGSTCSTSRHYGDTPRTGTTTKP